MRPINIVASCDEVYAQHLGVMLRSLCESNPDEQFRVFLLTTVGPDTLRKLSECVGHRSELRLVRIDTGRLDSLPLSKYATQAVYYRLLLGDVLPPEVTRALYLDSDIVVTGSIAKLWHQDLGKNVVGAVQDEGFRDFQKVGLAESDKYFNSGVLLVDLDRWRRENIGPDSIAVARDEPDRITWWDQCALNIVLRGRWLPLDRRWNLQTNAIGPYDPHKRFGVTPTAEGLERLRSAIVIHFTNRTKPWQYLCEHPAKPRYWHYLRKTPWRRYRMPDLSLHNVIRKNLFRYCPRLLPAYLRLSERSVHV